MRALAIAFLVVALAGAVRADDQPWMQLPVADQDRATALFEEGNRLFEQAAHAPALAKYREAIAIWDHPLIRFNLAVVLIRLDRWLEAAEELDLALRHGAAPFGDSDQGRLYLQALDYRALLERSLGYVEASCTQAGVEVTLDGKPWFRCPGTRKQRVEAAAHTLGGELAGHLPRSQRLVVTGGATVRERIALVSLDEAVVVRYPVRRFIPWTVVAGGGVLALVGLGVRLSGDRDMTRFEERYAQECPRGCPPSLPDHPDLRHALDGARSKLDIGTGMLVAGGVVVIGGVVAVILNRPVRELPRIGVTGTSTHVAWQF